MDTLLFISSLDVCKSTGPASLYMCRERLGQWCASLLSCTGLPKTGATNQNAPRLISEYLCLLRKRNDSNSITIVKETRELGDKE